MDSREFMEGYREPANHLVARRYAEPDSEVQDIMEGPRKWTSYFDRLLVLHLKDEQNGANEPGYMFNELRKYELGWLNEHLNSTLKMAFDISERNLEALPALHELGFHVINKEVMPIWYNLLLNSQANELTPQRIHSMQTHLSLRGAELQDKYQKYTLKELRSGVKSGITGDLSGILNEIDAEIVFLEIMKREGGGLPAHLSIVPAPPRFEAAHRNRHRSADFLIFDASTDQVRGIQVKTTVANETITKYDSDFITLVDTTRDFGNTRSSYTAGRGHHSVPAPGLIALDFLLNRTSIRELSRNPAFNSEMKSIFQAREIARAVFGKKKPYLDTAVTQVGERILTDLYK